MKISIKLLFKVKKVIGKSPIKKRGSARVSTIHNKVWQKDIYIFSGLCRVTTIHNKAGQKTSKYLSELPLIYRNYLYNIYHIS